VHQLLVGLRHHTPSVAVYVTYSRGPATAYLAPTLVSPLPGSGTYDMVVTVKWHDEFNRGEARYFIPLWGPAESTYAGETDNVGV